MSFFRAAALALIDIFLVGEKPLVGEGTPLLSAEFASRLSFVFMMESITGERHIRTSLSCKGAVSPRGDSSESVQPGRTKRKEYL